MLTLISCILVFAIIIVIATTICPSKFSATLTATIAELYLIPLLLFTAILVAVSSPIWLIRIIIRKITTRQSPEMGEKTKEEFHEI